MLTPQPNPLFAGFQPQLDRIDLMGLLDQEDPYMQPTQVAEPMQPQPQPPMRSVLQGRREQELQEEQQLRTIMDQMRRSGKRGF